MASESQPTEPKIISSRFLDSSDTKDNLAIVVLNWKLPLVTPLLLEKAAFCVCADGGANRLHDEVPAMFPTETADVVRSRFLPHLIKGDLDSVRPDVLEFYTSHGVPIVNLSHDQMSTDLQKCLKYIETHLLIGGGERTRGFDISNEKAEGNSTKTKPPRTDSAPNIQRQVDTIVAIGAHGGRLDHILSNLSTLHAFREVDIVLCGDGNLSRLIPAGKAVIKPHRKVEGPSCGLIPLQGRAVASSRGLRWNLESTEMEIGGLVSTSNIIDADEVLVETDVDLIWTTELKEPIPRE